MLGNIGIPTLILILVLALLLFGPNKLPELGRAFGRTLREFKQGAKEIMEDEDNGSSRKELNGSASHSTMSESTRDEQRDNPRRLPE